MCASVERVTAMRKRGPQISDAGKACTGGTARSD